MDSKNNKNDKAFLWLILSILLIYMVFHIYKGARNNESLSENYFLGKAKIIEFEKHAYKSYFPAKYKYTYLGKEYNGEISSSAFCKELTNQDKKALREISFDVAIDSLNPIVSEILTSKKDYVNYSVAFPYNNNELSNAFDTYFECQWSLWRILN